MKPQCPIRELVMVKYGGELNVSGNRQSKHKWDLGKCVLQVHLTGCVEVWKMGVEGKRDCDDSSALGWTTEYMIKLFTEMGVNGGLTGLKEGNETHFFP